MYGNIHIPLCEFLTYTNRLSMFPLIYIQSKLPSACCHCVSTGYWETAGGLFKVKKNFCPKGSKPVVLSLCQLFCQHRVYRLCVGPFWSNTGFGIWWNRALPILPPPDLVSPHTLSFSYPQRLHYFLAVIHPWQWPSLLLLALGPLLVLPSCLWYPVQVLGLSTSIYPV